MFDYSASYKSGNLITWLRHSVEERSNVIYFLTFDKLLNDFCCYEFQGCSVVSTMGSLQD
jgi:sulfatase maturation enzyme AslB (radical SAM superfamily)